MADIQLDDGRNGGDGPDRIEGEPVSRMTFQAQLFRRRGGIRDAPELAVLLGAFGIAIGARVQFDHRRP